MMLLVGLIVGGAWAFYVALLLDRPDMAQTLAPPWPMALHVVFAVVFLATVYRYSHREIATSKSWWRHGPGIYLRNLVVLGLGMALILFTCREVLGGVDPSGVRQLW